MPAVPAAPATEALPVAAVAPVAPTTPAVPVRANLAVPRLTAAGLAFLGWAVVASAFLLRLAVLRARLLTTLGERAPVVDPMVRARLEGLCQDVGHARPVRLTTAEGLRSPVALGWSESASPPRRSSSSTTPSNAACSPTSSPTFGGSTRYGW